MTEEDNSPTTLPRIAAVQLASRLASGHRTPDTGADERVEIRYCRRCGQLLAGPAPNDVAGPLDGARLAVRRSRVDRFCTRCSEWLRWVYGLSPSPPMER